MNLEAEDMNGVQVSVMVTFYNQKHYVKGCMEAIVAQETDFRFEILCGDDYYTSKLKLQKQYDILEKNPSLSCCCHSMTMVWENGDHPDAPFGYFSDRPFIISNKAYWAGMYAHAEALK